MMNLRRCFACQPHCNYIESGLQVHEVLLTEKMFTHYSQFLNFFSGTHKDERSPVLSLYVFTSQNTTYSLC